MKRLIILFFILSIFTFKLLHAAQYANLDVSNSQLKKFLKNTVISCISNTASSNVFIRHPERFTKKNIEAALKIKELSCGAFNEQKEEYLRREENRWLSSYGLPKEHTINKAK